MVHREGENSGLTQKLRDPGGSRVNFKVISLLNYKAALLFHFLLYLMNQSVSKTSVYMLKKKPDTIAAEKVDSVSRVQRLRQSLSIALPVEQIKNNSLTVLRFSGEQSQFLRFYVAKCRRQISSKRISLCFTHRRSEFVLFGSYFIPALGFSFILLFFRFTFLKVINFQM